MTLGGLLVAGLLILSLVRPGPTLAEAQSVVDGARSQELPAPAVQAPAAPVRSITVVGEGKVTIKPDVAQTNIGVEVLGDTVKQASTQNQETMNAVMAALKAQGIEDKDMQTSGYNVWVERPYVEGVPSDKVIYHVSNNVTVTIRDLEKVGPALDAAIEAGANNIYGVTFSVADPSRLMSEARDKATQDALAKAGALAKLNQVTLGDLISVSEVIAQGGFYAAGLPRAAAEGLGGGGGGPITPGQLEVSVQLQATYSIQ
jgi:uncharacterized protein YggE